MSQQLRLTVDPKKPKYTVPRTGTQNPTGIHNVVHYYICYPLWLLCYCIYSHILDLNMSSVCVLQI